MKVFVVLASFLAAALAAPSQLAVLPFESILNTGIISTAPAKTQYHAQDALGQYRYGYSNELSAKEELKTFDGVTRGSYSYVDANGELQSVDYTADALNGFRVAATNLPKALPVPELEQPKPIEETAEVTAAKAAHLAAIEEAKTRSTDFRPAEHAFDVKDLPKQVEDTPEVAKAKAEHFAAKKEAELRSSVVENLKAEPVVESSVNTLVPTFPAAPVFKLAEHSPLPIFRTAYVPHAYAYAPFDFNTRFIPRAFVY